MLFFVLVYCLVITFTGADATAETGEDKGLGFTCTSEESEGDDSGFICATLRFVPWVDTSAPVGEVKEVVALFLLEVAGDESTDEEETVCEVVVVLFDVLDCVTSCRSSVVKRFVVSFVRSGMFWRLSASGSSEKDTL